jgi:hypothetical protein
MGQKAFLLMSSLVMSQIALASSASSKQTVSGNGPLAFASLVAEHSPLLTAQEKRIMADLLEGRLHFKYSAGKKISVDADSIVCSESNVAIATRSCDLKFGKKTISIKGRKAHELFATLVEIGVPSDGAAGTIYESLSHLTCAIDPHEIQQNAGGGAQCQFDPGSP